MCRQAGSKVSKETLGAIQCPAPHMRTSTMASLAPTVGNSVPPVSSSGSNVSRSSQASVSASAAVSGAVVEML